MSNYLKLLIIIPLASACNDGANDLDAFVGEWTASIQSTTFACGRFPDFDAHFFVDKQPEGLTFTDVAWTDVVSSATFDNDTINVVVDNDPTNDPQLHIKLAFFEVSNGAVDVSGSVRLRGSAYPTGSCVESLTGFGVHYPQ